MNDAFEEKQYDKHPGDSQEQESLGDVEKKEIDMSDDSKGDNHQDTVTAAGRNSFEENQYDKHPGESQERESLGDIATAKDNSFEEMQYDANRESDVENKKEVMVSNNTNNITDNSSSSSTDTKLDKASTKQQQETKATDIDASTTEQTSPTDTESKPAPMLASSENKSQSQSGIIQRQKQHDYSKVYLGSRIYSQDSTEDDLCDLEHGNISNRSMDSNSKRIVESDRAPIRFNSTTSNAFSSHSFNSDDNNKEQKKTGKVHTTPSKSSRPPRIKLPSNVSSSSLHSTSSAGGPPSTSSSAGGMNNNLRRSFNGGNSFRLEMRTQLSGENSDDEKEYEDRLRANTSYSEDLENIGLEQDLSIRESCRTALNEPLSDRSDCSIPDMHDFLALLTCFPTLPVIGMFKDEMLPLPGDKNKGSESNEEYEELHEEDDEDEEEDLEYEENEFPNILDKDEGDLENENRQDAITPQATHDRNDDVHECPELSMSMTFDNEQVNTHPHDEISRAEVSHAHGEDFISTPSFGRAASSPNIGSMDEFDHGSRRFSVISDANGEERDKVTIKSQASCDSDSSNQKRGFLGSQSKRAQSFNLRRLKSEGQYSSKKRISGGYSAEFDAIKAKEFEVARANSKRKRIKRKILNWMQEYTDKINSNEHPTLEDAKEVLTQLNIEYDEIYLKKDALELELAKLKADLKGEELTPRKISPKRKPDARGHYFRQYSSLSTSATTTPRSGNEQDSNSVSRNQSTYTTFDQIEECKTFEEPVDIPSCVIEKIDSSAEIDNSAHQNNAPGITTSEEVIEFEAKQYVNDVDETPQDNETEIRSQHTSPDHNVIGEQQDFVQKEIDIEGESCFAVLQYEKVNVEDVNDGGGGDFTAQQYDRTIAAANSVSDDKDFGKKSHEDEKESLLAIPPATQEHQEHHEDEGSSSKSKPGWYLSELDQWRDKDSMPLSSPDFSPRSKEQPSLPSHTTEEDGKVAKTKLEPLTQSKAVSEPELASAMAKRQLQELALKSPLKKTQRGLNPATEDDDMALYLAQKKRAQQKLAEDNNLEIDISDTTLEQRQAQRESELQQAFALAESKKAAEKKLSIAKLLSDREQKLCAEQQLRLLQTEKEVLADESKLLSEREAQLQRDELALAAQIADMQSKRSALHQQAQEAKQRRMEMQLRSNEVAAAYASHTETVQHLVNLESERLTEKRRREQKLLEDKQLLAEHSSVDETYVPVPLPEHSVLAKETDMDLETDRSSERIVFAAEDCVEKSVLEDDLLSDYEKSLAAKNRKQFIQHKEEIEQKKEEFRLKQLADEERAAEMEAERKNQFHERQEILREDILSQQVEAMLKQEIALKKMYQEILENTMRDVLEGIEEKRILEEQERQFEADSHVLIQKELKARYDRQVQALIRKEKSKNQSDLSSAAQKNAWLLEEQHLLLSSQLTRMARKHTTAFRNAQEQSDRRLADIQCQHDKDITSLQNTLAAQKDTLHALESSLKEEKEHRAAAESTLAGESARTASAVTASLHKQAEAAEEYKRNLPAMATQTDEDKELQNAYADIEMLQKDKEALKDTISDLNYELESAQTELKELKVEFAAATSEYSDAVSTVRDHKDKSKFLTLKLAAADVEIERINKERVKIAETLQQRADAQSDLETQCLESAQEVKFMRQQVSEMQEEQQNYKTKLSEAKRKLREVRNQLMGSQEEVRQLQKESSPRPQIDVLSHDKEDDDEEDGVGLSPDRQSHAEARNGINGMGSLTHQNSVDSSGDAASTTTGGKSVGFKNGLNSPRLEPLLPIIGRVQPDVNNTGKPNKNTPKQFGKLLHIKEKKKKSASPDKITKNHKKFQQYQELQQQQQQQLENDLVIKEVDAMGNTLENNDSHHKDKDVINRKTKSHKVSCSECNKKVSKADVKKLPCVLKNLHHGKKITADGILLYGDVDDDEVIQLLEDSLQDNSKDDSWQVADTDADTAQNSYDNDTHNQDGEGVEAGASYLRSNLDNQFLFRDKYGHRRGSQCKFCSWDCARTWNTKHTPIQHRHTTSQLISIAEGRFV